MSELAYGVGLPLDERLDPTTARGALLALVRCATAPPRRGRLRWPRRGLLKWLHLPSVVVGLDLA